MGLIKKGQAVNFGLALRFVFVTRLAIFQFLPCTSLKPRVHTDCCVPQHGLIAQIMLSIGVIPSLK